jgi:PAS domain S-box-containing protein
MTAEPRPASSITAPPGAGRVLVVEDDSGTAELVRRTLVRAGYTVQIAGGVEDGLKALSQTETAGFDALLLDYRLPDGEPWTVADAALACVPEVPVVFVTGMGDELVAIEALHRGVADYVKKDDGFWKRLPEVLERVALNRLIKGRLDQTSAMMPAVVEHLRDLVAISNADGSLVYLSPVCFNLLGRQADELVGHSWLELVALEDRDELLKACEGLGENGSSPINLRCLHKNGSLALMEARVSRIKFASLLPTMIVLTLHDVTEQREYEQRMEAALHEKDLLLREIHHRVKNNLQVVQSLLKMRARLLPKGETRDAIESTVQRVFAMSLAHEHLYRMKSLDHLSLSAYLRDLFKGVEASSSKRAGQIEFRLNAEEIPLTMDLAIPFGLLANELISNCFKHGFQDDRRGVIELSIHRASALVRMVVEDDGTGLPENFNAAACNSMGLKLALSLAHQLGGTLVFTTGKGCRVQGDFSRL